MWYYCFEIYMLSGCNHDAPCYFDIVEKDVTCNIKKSDTKKRNSFVLDAIASFQFSFA